LQNLGVKAQKHPELTDSLLKQKEKLETERDHQLATLG
jgi:hypothetical protein